MSKTVFSDGNPAATPPVKGTKVTAAFLTAMQEHVHDGGSTDSKCPKVDADLLDNIAQAHTDPGYVRLPGGIVLQWGTGVEGTSAEENQTITFPIPFSTACLSVQVSTLNATVSDIVKDMWFQVVSWNDSSVVVKAQRPTGGGDPGAEGTRPKPVYLAIGH